MPKDKALAKLGQPRKKKKAEPVKIGLEVESDLVSDFKRFADKAKKKIGGAVDKLRGSLPNTTPGGKLEELLKKGR